MSRLVRDGTAEPVSRGQILRRERGQGKIYFPCSADHEQDWQSYPVDPCDNHTYYLDSDNTNIRVSLRQSLDPRYGRAVLAWDCNILY